MTGASIRAILIHNKRTKEGENLKFFETDLDVQVDSAGSDLFLLWPITIVHKINEDSPFYRLSAADMLKRKFEIVLILQGTVQSTGQGTNAQTSYLANEILWGHRFATMVSFNPGNQCYEANYDNFEKTVRIQMPMCSVADIKGNQTTDDNEDGDTKPTDDVSEQSKESLELPSSTNTKKGKKKSVTETIARPVREKTQLTVPVESPPSYTSSTVRPQNPLSQSQSRERVEIHSPRLDDYPSRRHTIELDGSIQRPKLVKFSSSRCSHIHHSQYENIPEEEERSETPPFPISWV